MLGGKSPGRKVEARGESRGFAVTRKANIGGRKIEMLDVKSDKEISLTIWRWARVGSAIN